MTRPSLPVTYTLPPVYEDEKTVSFDMNIVELVSSNDSKITNVRLYSGHAEITRRFQFDIKAGLNRITIVGLPDEMDDESLKAEVQGKASIGNISVSRLTPPPRDSPSDAEEKLRRKWDDVKMDLDSAEQSREALKAYLQNINSNDYDIPRLETTLDDYRTLSHKIDQQILELATDLRHVSKDIEEECDRSRKAAVPTRHNWKASLDVHTLFEEDFTMFIKYVVDDANWSASYEIRVDTKAEGKDIAVLYKAIITQDTGESWDGVSVILETSPLPAYGAQPPVLPRWPVFIPKPLPPGHPVENFSMCGPVPMVYCQCQRCTPPPRCISPISVARMLNKGGVVATMHIPGVITVPSDGERHTVTIAQLYFNGTLMRYSVPFIDTRVFFKVNLRNNSEYSLVPGNAKIFLDGNFIETTELPSVNPQEEFDCPLGLDPSIQIVYPSRERKLSRSGFFYKTLRQSFTQRITIYNTKPTTVQNLIIIDGVPTSEDEEIKVKVRNPSLPMPTSDTLKTDPILTKPVCVGPDIYVQWEDANDVRIEQNIIGRDGKLKWSVTVPPKHCVPLVLQYEVKHPGKLIIDGL